MKRAIAALVLSIMLPCSVLAQASPVGIFATQSYRTTNEQCREISKFVKSTLATSKSEADIASKFRAEWAKRKIPKTSGAFIFSILDKGIYVNIGTVTQSELNRLKTEQNGSSEERVLQYCMGLVKKSGEDLHTSYQFDEAWAAKRKNDPATVETVLGPRETVQLTNLCNTVIGRLALEAKQAVRGKTKEQSIALGLTGVKQYQWKSQYGRADSEHEFLDAELRFKEYFDALKLEYATQLTDAEFSKGFQSSPKDMLKDELSNSCERKVTQWWIDNL